MSSCCSGCCTGIARQFDAKTAAGDLHRYREKGPGPTTRLLREFVARVGVGDTVLDIGAGIGALSFELLAGGFRSATAVDAAPAYLAAARSEAERRGRSDVFTTLEGDFVALDRAVPPADVVVMDRVVCCYPAVEPLLNAAFTHSRRLLGMSYPRDRWYVRLVMGIENVVRRLQRSPFRTFVHRAAAIESAAARHGFRQVAKGGSYVWAVVLYERTIG